MKLKKEEENEKILRNRMNSRRFIVGFYILIVILFK